MTNSHERTIEQVLAEVAAAHGLTAILEQSEVEFHGVTATPKTEEHYRLLADAIPHLSWPPIPWAE